MSDQPYVNPEYPVEMPHRRILDHGFVALVDVMGNDASIVQSARVSYGKGTKTVRSDKALISYLMRHRHTTPFEMVEFKFIMRLPVFIARQVIRHRTANVNEYSARYSEVPYRFWTPSLGAIAEQDTVNRQGRMDHLRELVESLPELTSPCAFVDGEKAAIAGDDGRGISRAGLLDPALRAQFDPACADMLPAESHVYWVGRLLEYFPERKRRLQEVQDGFADNNERCYALYRRMLEQGVAREIARGVLPLTMYTEWYWKIDLHNLFHFLKLRMDPHAQLEVRAFAEAMAEFVKPKVPYAWEAFEQDNLKGTFLSHAEKTVLRPVDDEAQREVLTALYEQGYRRRRLQETSRKLGIDERLVDELWPPRDA